MSEKTMMKKKPKSDLDKKIWAVVTHDQTLRTSLTYPQAIMYVDSMKNKLGNDLTIVTAEAAARQSVDRCLNEIA